ncbi:43664_t:CDS:1, partial [Gigaspora margarita]
MEQLQEFQLVLEVSVMLAGKGAEEGLVIVKEFKVNYLWNFIRE